MIFKTDLKLIESVGTVPSNTIPQLYRASVEFALQNSPADFRSLLLQLSHLTKNDGFTYSSIDIRTHMLMKGMFPCIPGWHCDDFYRPTNEQPDLANVEEKAPQVHYVVNLGNCSLTEFLTGDIRLPDQKDLLQDNPSYFYYDQMIEEAKLPTMMVEPNKIYSFGPTCFHRGTAAKENGWRTFIRLTRSNHRQPKNEIRYQSNVYIQGRTSW